VQLACTGLYASWPARTIAPQVRPYAPGLALWSDGADKRRYVELPAGTQIDTSDMDEWVFPVGTKLWKEFRLNGAPVETRFLWKRAPGDWFRTTYAWSADGASAAEITTGMLNVAGTSYEIPRQDMCTTCHQGRADGVLGFEAVSLAAPGASGVTLSALVGEGRLSRPPSAPIVVPGTATERAALGWLHANCGTACHNRSPAALAGATGLFLRLDVATLATVQRTDAWTTSVGVLSGFQPAPDAGMLRIAPGRPDRSAIYFRDSFRDDQGQDFQMPPIDTHVVDGNDGSPPTPLRKVGVRGACSRRSPRIQPTRTSRATKHWRSSASPRRARSSTRAQLDSSSRRGPTASYSARRPRSPMQSAARTSIARLAPTASFFRA
jgi:hypothetical protein